MYWALRGYSNETEHGINHWMLKLLVLKLSQNKIVIVAHNYSPRSNGTMLLVFLNPTVGSCGVFWEIPRTTKFCRVEIMGNNPSLN